MRNTFALLAVVVIFLLVAKSTIAAPGTPAVGDQLSLSITNKYGDVLANPIITQILGDGLVLQRGTLVMKVKYDDLPADVRRKYQPLATGAVKQQEKEGAADAAYLARTRQLQAEAAGHQVIQKALENAQAQARTPAQSTPANEYVIISIPNQNWKLTILNLGFSDWRKDLRNGQFLMEGLPGPSGFHLVLFVNPPANNLPGNDPVYNFFWSNMAHDSLIDAQTVKVERGDKFIKVSYTVQGQLNANYFFACHGQWVDLHLAKPSVEKGDEKLFADFDSGLSYSE